MLVGGWVWHKIEDHFETARMCGQYERVEILHGPEHRIGAGVVRNVVAEISHRGRKDRRQPDRVNAKPLQIGQPVDDPRDIPDPVTVRILKRARIDLIEYAVPPPEFVAPVHLRNHSLMPRYAM